MKKQKKISVRERSGEIYNLSEQEYRKELREEAITARENAKNANRDYNKDGGWYD